MTCVWGRTPRVVTPAISPDTADFNFCILYVTMWTTLCPNQWVLILPEGLDFVSGSGFCQWVWMFQWVWIWKPHGPDSLLYHVIYTQPWHNNLDLVDSFCLLFLDIISNSIGSFFKHEQNTHTKHSSISPGRTRRCGNYKGCKT